MTCLRRIPLDAVTAEAVDALGESVWLLAQLRWAPARQLEAVARGLAPDRPAGLWLPPTFVRPWKQVRDALELDEVEEAIAFGPDAALRLFRRRGARAGAYVWDGDWTPPPGAPAADERVVRVREQDGRPELAVRLHRPAAEGERPRFRFAEALGALEPGPLALRVRAYYDEAGLVDWRPLGFVEDQP